MNIIETNLSFKSLERRKITRRIITHHSASTTASPEDIHRWHLNKGYVGAGYQYLVRKDGKIYSLRPEWAVGAHAYGSNYDSIGICAEGDYTKETMPEAQKNSLKELVAYLKNKYNITVVQRHKDVCNTSCPGQNYPFNEIAGVKASNTNVSTSKKATGEIATIQSTLNSRYGYSIAVDNIYGNETRKALVKALQHELNVQCKKGLNEDGIFGNNTYNACINVKQGAKGNITWLIQAMLVCHALSVKVDGIYGGETANAIRTFQARNGLMVDGICGKNTFNKLFK